MPRLAGTWSFERAAQPSISMSLYPSPIEGEAYRIRTRECAWAAVPIDRLRRVDRRPDGPARAEAGRPDVHSWNGMEGMLRTCGRSAFGAGRVKGIGLANRAGSE